MLLNWIVQSFRNAKAMAEKSPRCNGRSSVPTDRPTDPRLPCSRPSVDKFYNNRWRRGNRIMKGSEKRMKREKRRRRRKRNRKGVGGRKLRRRK